MLYLFVIAAAAIIGIAAGRNKKKYSASKELRFEKTWLAILAFSLQIISRILGAKGIIFAEINYMLIQAVMIILLMLCFWFNRKHIGLWFVGAGALMNALVMFANGGRMPVDSESMKRAGIDRLSDALTSSEDLKHVILNENTRLWFLSDIIHLPGIIGIGMNVVSIGDLVIAFGLFLLVLEISYVIPQTSESKKGA